MTNSVSLQVNSQRLIQNLMNAFTSKYTFLSELMQNARRAGASYVRFTSTANTLCIEDDGHGIDNLQNLLTIADSGWSEQIRGEENPFGMGFMSALFAAKHIAVRSNGKSLNFSRDDALAQKSLVVENYSQDGPSGTFIELSGIGLTQYEMKDMVVRYAKGFPICVIFNGEACDRPLAWDQLETSTDRPESFEALVELPSIGRVAFYRDSYGCEMYLLGMKVHRFHRYYSSIGKDAILHLDPKSFTARLPDRDCLIDVGSVEEKIAGSIKDWWTARIESQLGILSDEEIVTKYWKIMTAWKLDSVMHKLKAVPAHCFSKLSDVPLSHRHGGEENNNLTGIEGNVITEEQVKSGRVVVCRELPEDLAGNNMIPAVIAYLKGWTILTKTLPENHWLMSYVIDLSKGEASVDFNAEAEDKFYGHIDLRVKLYKSPIRLSWQGHVCESSNVPVVFWEGKTSNIVALIPQVYCAETVLRMADPYADGDYEFFDDSLRDDADSLSLLIQSLQDTDPAVLLDSVLDNGGFSLPNTKGSAIVVITDKNGFRKSVNITHLLKPEFKGDVAKELTPLAIALAA